MRRIISATAIAVTAVLMVAIPASASPAHHHRLIIGYLRTCKTYRMTMRYNETKGAWVHIRPVTWTHCTSRTLHPDRLVP